MNIYLIRQSVNTDYDTFDSAVVVAESMDKAMHMHPGSNSGEWDGIYRPYDDWARVEDVEVRFLGTTNVFIKPEVICGSFNAG